jgi:hypothetical protein
MHAGAEPLTNARRLEAVAIVQKSLQFPYNCPWKAELASKLLIESGSKYRAFLQSTPDPFSVPDPFSLPHATT